MNSQLKVVGSHLVAYSKPDLSKQLRNGPVGMKIYIADKDKLVHFDPESVRVIVATDEQEAREYWTDTDEIDEDPRFRQVTN